MLSTTINETPAWRPVPGFEGHYEVSDAGEIRAAASGRIRRLFVRENGYRAVFLTAGARRKCVLVHSVMLSAFRGARPDGMVCRHRDGDPSNNTLLNLAWGTPAENSNDCRIHGRTPAGERNPKAKLTAKQVADIRQSAAKSSVLAGKFGVARRAIDNVRKGATWRSV